MRVWTYTEYRWDDERQEYVIDEAASRWEEYDGPVALCGGDGGLGIITGGSLLGGGGGGIKGQEAPGPDPALGQAANRSVKLGKEWLAFAREQAAIGNERQKGIDTLTKEVTGEQLEGMRDANQRSNDMWERYRTKFMPVEDRMIQDATEYDSPEKQAAAAAAAKADVLKASAEGRASRERRMAGMGIDPRSGRYAGIEREADTETALASAGAQNTARERVKTTGMALREGVANMGRGATSTAAQQASLGLSSGGAAAGTALGAEGNWRANTGIMQQGFQGALGANQTGAGIIQGMDSTRMAGAQLNESQRQANLNFFSDLAGSAAGIFTAMSSKDAKENKRPVKGALPALKGLNVESWDYKQGMGDGGHHIGPYAEDFQRETGMGDGKTINLIDAMGITMKAVQELDEKVERMATPKGRKPKTATEES